MIRFLVSVILAVLMFDGYLYSQEKPVIVKDTIVESFEEYRDANKIAGGKDDWSREFKKAGWLLYDFSI
jgi:hypothetical protein